VRRLQGFLQKMRKSKILAVSTSLTNTRWGKGIDNLIDKIKKIPNKKELMHFIFIEARVHFEQFSSKYLFSWDQRIKSEILIIKRLFLIRMRVIFFTIIINP
jgi:hypothetical protein